MNLRSEQKKQTRQKLITGAIHLIAQHGFAGTTTAALARALNLSHGTVFVHFPSREELVTAVIDEFGQRLSEKFSDCTSLEDFREILVFHLQVLAEIEDFYHHLINELYLLPPSIKGHVFLLHSAISWKMYETAKLGMNAGQYKTMTRPLLFNSWIALVHYYVGNRDLLSQTKPILKAKQKELVDHFIHLIQK